MYLQRKYVDLIHHVSSKWVNWDPPIPIEVGAYGVVEKETGDLRVEGNIYQPEFQSELDRLQLHLNMGDHPVQEGGPEEDTIYFSKGARRIEMAMGPQVGIAGLATASISGRWKFDNGRRDALLIMSCPRTRYLHNIPLKTLYKVPMLKGKWLVTTVHVCPAFSMYLSNKSGEEVSLALVGQVPVPAAPGISAGAEGSIGWWSDTQADVFRKGCDKAGNYCYTPLYTLKRWTPWAELTRHYRDSRGPEPQEEREHGWVDATPNWPPLDEDGEEDPIQMSPNEEGRRSDF